MVNSTGSLGPRLIGEASTIANGDVTPQEVLFWEYHEDNPDIYRLFDRYAVIAIEKGHKKLSPWLIVNRIRWEQHVIVRSNTPFKIANDYIAYYSRLWMIKRRRFWFFSTKVMVGEYQDQRWGEAYEAKAITNELQEASSF